MEAHDHPTGAVRLIVNREAYAEFPIDTVAALQQCVWANTLSPQLDRGAHDRFRVAKSIAKLWGALGFLGVATMPRESIEQCVQC